MGQPRGGSRKREKIMSPPRGEGEAGPDGRWDAYCATTESAPIRVRLFNLSVLLFLPLLAALLSPIFVSSFVVVVAPPINSLSWRRPPRCGENHRNGGGGAGSALRPSARAAMTEAAAGSRCEAFRPSRAVEDGTLEGIADAVASRTEASVKLSIKPTNTVVCW